MLKAIGLRAGLSDGFLFIRTVSKTIKFSIALEHLGLFPFLLYAFGGGALLFITGQSKGQRIKFFFVLSVYCLFRFLILLLIDIEINNPTVFWSSMITILSFLPLPIILTEFAPIFSQLSLPSGPFAQIPRYLSWPVTQSLNHPFPPSFSAILSFFSATAIQINFFRRSLIGMISSFFSVFSARRNPEQSEGEARNLLCLKSFALIGSFSLILAFGLHDPGMEKPGRIMIDEGHSRWEWTDERFDASLFGKRTDYNFYCLSEYLTYFYPQVKRNYQTLTRQLLTGIDILMLKTPTCEYIDEEVDAIRDFVAKGGGLFLIGDHTNVFGMSTYLNKVAKVFGLTFQYDVTYDLPTYKLSLYRRPHLFPHPVVQHIPQFLFGSSCTLSIPLNAASVMTGYGLRNHYLDYSQKNFFPIPEEDSDYGFGLFVQSAAINYKKGRVLAYTDSTCFSNFFMFIPGKPELLLGSMEWLNRKNRFGWVNVLLFLVSLACLSLILCKFRYMSKLRGKRENFLYGFLIFVVAGVTLGIMVSRFVNQKTYVFPKAKRNFFRIALESEHSSFFLPVNRLAEGSDKSFLTFFVWIQRLGYVPCLKPSLEDALKEGKLVVLIDPVKDFSGQERAKLKNYLVQGGVVLIMDSPYNYQSTSNQVLKELEMEIDSQRVIKGKLWDQGRTPIGEIDRAFHIKGGSALLADRENKAVLSTKRYGAGIIAVFTASHLFRDESLGYTNSIPDKYQRWLSEMEFWIFESLAKREFTLFSHYSSEKINKNQ